MCISTHIIYVYICVKVSKCENIKKDSTSRLSSENKSRKAFVLEMVLLKI